VIQSDISENNYEDKKVTKLVRYFKLHIIGLNKLNLFKLLWKKDSSVFRKSGWTMARKGFLPFVGNTLSGDCGLMELRSAKPPPYDYAYLICKSIS